MKRIMASERSSDEIVCRLCDKHNNKLYSIFEQSNDGHQIIHLIKECFPLIIYRTDPLSKYACANCIENLNFMHRFRKTVLEIAHKQHERLKNAHIINNSIELYLSQLNCENDDEEGIIQKTDIPVKAAVADRTTSPCLENGQNVNLCTNCKTCIAEPESNEIEMCAELHKAIADSLKKNNQHLQDSANTDSQVKNVVLRSKRKRNEGFYTEFDDSQDSSITTDITCTESTQNTESQSDMELCDSDHEFAPRIIMSENVDDKPVVKKRRLMGPKSVQEYNAKLSIQKATEMEDTIIYNPLSLLKLSVNKINSVNVPDFVPVCFEETIVKNECNYCHEIFANIKMLAVHEAEHIHIELGLKIDDSDLWDTSREDADVRNKWLEKFQEDEVEDVEEDEEEEHVGDLLVPVATATTQPLKGEVVLLDGKPTVNGVLLSELPKDERRTLYRNITISGVKRKFCPLCRYTFKDNWAIESHYFSSSCYYTCRYCGIRFNKQRYQFEEHIKQHQAKGDEPSSKVFAPRKWNGAFPKVISETKLKPRSPPKLRAPLPKVKPMSMKHLLERKSLQPNLRVKTDLMQDNAGGHAPTNQAYFCRKCYQVFFKLDEFNTHVTTCSGTQSQPSYNSNTSSGHLKNNSSSSSQHSVSNTSVNSDTESYSLAGRPIRHCVKEVGTYKDELDIEKAIERYNKAGPVKSGRGYECGLCNSAFPTVHSRNSHMRIHKNDDFKINNYVNNQSDNLANQIAEHADEEIPTFSSYISDAQIKQEPLEPIVEINENPHNFPSSIGSVSITPIPKPGVNPNIMKLVQNNPHLTIKSMSNNSHSTPAGSLSNFSGMEADKTYKCANCAKTFGNKSHLYFHKKNQCGGSKYPCPFCKKRFGTEAAYSSHIFYSHPE